MAAKRWIPLESNPSVLNKYMRSLGVEEKWQFVDVFGLDEELLALVARPVLAVMLLYPLSEQSHSAEIGCVDRQCLLAGGGLSIYYTKQTIGNACGTVALLHCLANNRHNISFHSDKYFVNFLDKTKCLSPTEKAAALEHDEKLDMTHEENAQDGDTEVPSRESSVNRHFVAFVHLNGKLYEMDGRKEAPVCHGPCTPDTILEDTAGVVRQFIHRDPSDINFTMMALCKVD